MRPASCRWTISRSVDSGGLEPPLSPCKGGVLPGELRARRSGGVGRDRTSVSGSSDRRYDHVSYHSADWAVRGNRTLVFRSTTCCSSTELRTACLAGARGVEPRSLGLESSVLPLDQAPSLVWREAEESNPMPRSTGCVPGSAEPRLGSPPVFWRRAEESNPMPETRSAFEAVPGPARLTPHSIESSGARPRSLYWWAEEDSNPRRPWL